MLWIYNPTDTLVKTVQIVILKSTNTYLHHVERVKNCNHYYFMGLRNNIGSQGVLLFFSESKTMNSTHNNIKIRTEIIKINTVF